MCLDNPPSLTLQTIAIHAPPTPVRCVSEQGFGFSTPMRAVPFTRRGETRTSLWAAAVGTGRRSRVRFHNRGTLYDLLYLLKS